MDFPPCRCHFESIRIDAKTHEPLMPFPVGPLGSSLILSLVVYYQAVLEKAYKKLLDPDQKKVYQRVMREAKERTIYERKQEDKRRARQGLPLLPQDTFLMDYKAQCQKLFWEIEEKRQHIIKQQEAQKKAKQQEMEEYKVKEKFRQLSEEDWEKTRDERVGKWREFDKKKANEKLKYRGTKAPVPKMEQRSINATKIDFKNDEKTLKL